MPLSCKKASRIAIYCLLAGVISACVNNPAYTSLDGPARRGNAPSQGTQNTSEQSIRVETSSRPGVSQSNTTPAARPGYYRVKPGDTLYSIAFRYGLDFRKLAHANNISSNYTIHPGQEIALRESEPARPSQSASRPAEANPRQTAPGPVARESSTGGAPPASPAVTKTNNSSESVRTTATATASGSRLEWAWPHDGKIVRTFRANVSDQKGVDLAGQIGDSVRAAANGTVVYAGNGLPGYGNLIIVEHPGSLLSAYAFNQELLVSEQDSVSRGQVIARMGNQGDQPGLHFEIREEGKPVDPMRYLPRR